MEPQHVKCLAQFISNSLNTLGTEMDGCLQDANVPR